MGGTYAATSAAAISPEESARGLIRRIAELSPETSGAFRNYRGEELAW